MQLLKIEITGHGYVDMAHNMQADDLGSCCPCGGSPFVRMCVWW